MATKKYKISYEWWEAVLEIEHTEQTLNNIKEQLTFFMGCPKSTQESTDWDGLVSRYLRQIAPHLLWESMEWNLTGVIRQFQEGGKYEGYLPIGGEFGVKLILIDTWEFPSDEFNVEEVVIK